MTCDEQMQYLIKNKEIKIPLHKKATNFIVDDREIYEEYNYFVNIENYKASYDLFQMSYPYLDRYSDIKPYKFNTVQISSKTGYINASPINIRDKKNYFISTQGPKPETVEDFWTMVSDYNSNVIVMLCKVTEGGRRKCENYWEAKKYEKF